MQLYMICNEAVTYVNYADTKLMHDESQCDRQFIHFNIWITEMYCTTVYMSCEAFIASVFAESNTVALTVTLIPSCLKCNTSSFEIIKSIFNHVYSIVKLYALASSSSVPLQWLHPA